MSRALEHLEDAEAAIISHISATSVALESGAEDGDIPDALPMLFAVLRSISRAAGALENEQAPNVSAPRYREGT
jgi:hypothetical protein